MSSYTNTTNIELRKPDYRSSRWDLPLNYSLDVVDGKYKATGAPIRDTKTLTVGDAGCDYTTITAALTAAGAIATSGNHILVWVEPGDYFSEAAITVPQYVTLTGFGIISPVVTAVNGNLCLYDQNGIFDVTGTMAVGDGTNYTEIEADGTLVAHGNATVWDDQQVDIGKVHVGASAPTWTAYKGCEVLAFDKAQSNKIYFIIQLTHRYKLNSNIEMHLHTTPADDTAGDVRWVLTVSMADIGDDFPAESTFAAVQTIAANTADKHILFEISGNVGSAAGVSSFLLCSLTRTGGTDDDYDNDIYLLGLDSHIEMDTMGSRLETSK